MRLQLAGPSYDTDIANFEQQRCINWFLQGGGDSAQLPKFQQILRPTPGITQLFDFGDFASGRGSVVYRDVAYVVLEDTFCVIEEDGTPSYIDLLATSTGPVSMFGGFDGIILADGTNAYYYNVDTNVFTTCTDGDLPANPTSCTYLDGFYILTFANSQKAHYSTDPLNWDALDFVLINSTPGNVVWCVADHQELWFFGTSATEVWYNSGDALLPLARRQGILISKGCRAPNTVVATDNTFYWLGTDPAGGYQVYYADGYNAKLCEAQSGISTQIATYETTTDAYAYVHRVGQHPFYVLTFPTENVTWVFDLYNRMWHQRTSVTTEDPFDADYEPYFKAHRAKNYFYAYGTHFVLDQYTGSIAKYDENVYTEYTMPLIRTRRTSQLSADRSSTGGSAHSFDNQLHSYYNLILNMQPGVGLSTGQGSDPQVMLNISTDGGFTWDDCGSQPIGAQGVYGNEIKWDILGQARSMVFEISVSDPVKAVLLGCTVDVVKDSN